MTWQDELRRLDAELAAGRITHDQHRRQREEILAIESGFPVPSRRATRQDERPRGSSWQSENPATGTSEQPPAQPRQPEPPVQPQQSISARLLANGKPTTAPSPADERPTESLPYPDVTRTPRAELTMPMRPVPPPGGGPPPPPTPPRPPSSDRGRRPTWLFLALGVLLVLGMIVGGAWWLGQSGGTPSGPATTTAATPSAASETALEDRLPALPGTPSPDDSTMSVDTGVDLGLYPREFAKIFHDFDVHEVVHRASTDGEDAYFVLVLPMEDGSEAKRLAERMRTVSRQSGFTLHRQSQTLTGELAGRRLSGTWYAADNAVVNVWVSQPPGGDIAVLNRLSAETIAALHVALPPA
ncbi:hypothetical protein B0I33_105430 [Prauserella shujinwangii]|uniref:Uncharacterized protein n=1 Tax=Prauserella shujinwangii TaxID=1453103 RepID=A0A2T0LVL8_9PSEU|nr:hypothetical protein [Prauserella shujinwangii]PRX47847.1 hypothetical protein B0I33_105430 [Prauserella shujinwangii]